MEEGSTPSRYEHLDKKDAENDRRRTQKCSACFLIATLLVGVYTLACVRIIPAATVGVLARFGHVNPKPLTAGLHYVYPISSVETFDIKTILFEQANHVPTKEGVTVELDVAMLFHVVPEQVPQLYLSLGAGYVNTLIAPEMASAVRGLTSEADASALYTSGRAEMQTKLQDELTRVLKPRGIIVESVLLKGVVLPTLLTDAIDKKAQAEQDAARMQYVIQKERQEAERKRIEAGGIADFQRIVSEGISPETLTWKAIETTQELAMSTNAKLVIVGNSLNSLPVMLSANHGGIATPAPLSVNADSANKVATGGKGLIV
mmetsp:Transcript_23286/g.59851  ORF Transcript_23286/g.59851 Transcript_23286/m.59851 type:complete len:318 (-) Transcript_23286:885-1838(-)|eukprot:CAMPEP_0119406524 /NCGR_PEP_ID=MMETSP1335-20130426/814_1 /TAXON_ID=259385 /ORGANISM="Chrysoculter rhomboideus, Strain RCC1486" /LENGTH=317 /DNA_ID=CAMNT_0007430605 /DNA_START=47 /DNA_END=1000 /DNA_ORIENTATION=+